MFAGAMIVVGKGKVQDIIVDSAKKLRGTLLRGTYRDVPERISSD